MTQWFQTFDDCIIDFQKRSFNVKESQQDPNLVDITGIQENKSSRK